MFKKVSSAALLYIKHCWLYRLILDVYTGSRRRDVYLRNALITTNAALIFIYWS